MIFFTVLAIHSLLCSSATSGQLVYTVMIHGKEAFLFHEGDKWFVEEKEASL